MDGARGTAPLLTVAGVTRPGLRPVTMSLAAGDVVVVSGPSGAGKSLLLRALADLDPNDGTVSLSGRDRRSVPAPAWRRLVAYVPPDSGWWTDRVGAHMADKTRAASMLGRLGLAADALDWPVARLSTGERQRLALIRALALEPTVLLLDEPTSGLDPAATAAVEALIRETCAAGTCAVAVTHDAAQAGRLGAVARYRMEAGTLHEDVAP